MRSTNLPILPAIEAPPMSPLRRAVFLDRDGVLVHDDGFILREDQIRLMDGVSDALRALSGAGMALIVVTNQAAVARGLIAEPEIVRLNEVVADRIEDAGGPRPDAFYYCPHHPDADLVEYRVHCACRKPRPGMLQRAAEEHCLDLRTSFLVGDRMSDIAAGAAATCRTVLVTCGRHSAPPIVTVDTPSECRPDHVCADLQAASNWILSQR
jgi:D-glycero-D-manno-heptose 1,7-bisphosphate phosphatase